MQTIEIPTASEIVDTHAEPEQAAAVTEMTESAASCAATDSSGCIAAVARCQALRSGLSCSNAASLRCAAARSAKVAVW